MYISKIINLFPALLLLAITGMSAIAQSSEAEVAQIRKLYSEIGKKIEVIEKGGEQGRYGELVCNELIVNKFDHTWPAVGNYKLVYKFYYDTRDDGDSPYPDRLVKVVIRADMAARYKYEEMLFNKTGDLVFYFSKEPSGDDPSKSDELRIYYSVQKVVRILRGQTAVDRLSAEDNTQASQINMQAAQVKDFFSKSISLQ